MLSLSFIVQYCTVLYMQYQVLRVQYCTVLVPGTGIYRQILNFCSGSPCPAKPDEVDSTPTLDLETPIRDKSIPHFSKNRSFTNLLGVNEVNDLFLKNEV